METSVSYVDDIRELMNTIHHNKSPIRKRNLISFIFQISIHIYSGISVYRDGRGSMYKNHRYYILLGLILIISIVTQAQSKTNIEISENETPRTPMSSADGDFKWNATLDSDGVIYSSGIWASANYIYTCGYSFAHGSYIAKWTTTGGLMWQENYTSIIQQFLHIWGDGEFLYIAGSDLYSIEGIKSVILKCSLQGDIIWQRNLTEKIYEIWGYENNLYVCGYADDDYTNYPVGANLFLSKWNTEGDNIWNTTWENDFRSNGYSIMGNKNYIYVCGWKTGEFGEEILLTKWDDQGTLLWNTSYTQGTSSKAHGIWVNSNKITVCGSKSEYGKTNMVIVQWNENGKILWNSSTNCPNENYCIGYGIWGDQSNLYCTGNMHQDTFLGDVILGKWTMTGKLVWTKTWNPLNTGEAASLALYGNGDSLYITGAIQYAINHTVYSDMFVACLEIEIRRIPLDFKIFLVSISLIAIVLYFRTKRKSH